MTAVPTWSEHRRELAQSALAVFFGFPQNLQKLRYTSNLTAAVNGSVAQLVEQRIENPRVGGSIPSQATKYYSTGVRWSHEALSFQ